MILIQSQKPQKNIGNLWTNSKLNSFAKTFSNNINNKNLLTNVNKQSSPTIANNNNNIINNSHKNNNNIGLNPTSLRNKLLKEQHVTSSEQTAPASPKTLSVANAKSFANNFTTSISNSFSFNSIGNSSGSNNKQADVIKSKSILFICLSLL